MGAIVLAVLVAVVVAAVREALARVGERRGSIGLAASLALLAFVPALIGRGFDSIVAGVVVIALVAAPLAVLHVRRRAFDAVVDEPASAARMVTVACAWIVFLLVAAVVWSTYLWDEDSAHFGVSSAIARGVLPAQHPYFPGQPFRYHLGYDVLVGAVRAFTDWRPDVCCDVVTTASLAVLLAILADAGRALAGPRGAAFAVIVVLFGYGPAAMCLAGGWSIPLSCSAWFPSSWVDARTMPPALVSSFLQHPQGLGMSISLAALLVAFAPPRTPAAASSPSLVARAFAAAVIAALLAQAQTVYFGMTGLALGVAAVVDVAVTRDVRTFAARIAFFAGAGASALASGGVLTQAGALDAIHFGAGYFKDTGARLVGHNLALFGATVVAIPLALYRARAAPVALRAGLVAAALCGFVVGNDATYDRSWDIVKFFAAGAFFANLLVADLFATWTAPRRLAITITAALVFVATTSSSTLWVLRHGILNGVIAPAYTELPPDPVGLALDAAHGRDIKGRDRVLTTHDDIAQLGFLVVGHDWRRAEHGLLLDRSRVDREHNLAHRALTTLDGKVLDDLDVGFVFLTEHELVMLQPAARALLEPENLERARILSTGVGFERLSDVVVGKDHWRLYRVVRP